MKDVKDEDIRGVCWRWNYTGQGTVENLLKGWVSQKQGHAEPGENKAVDKIKWPRGLQFMC